MSKVETVLLCDPPQPVTPKPAFAVSVTEQIENPLQMGQRCMVLVAFEVKGEVQYTFRIEKRFGKKLAAKLAEVCK